MLLGRDCTAASAPVSSSSVLGVMLAGEGYGVHGLCSWRAVSHCVTELFGTW